MPDLFEDFDAWKEFHVGLQRADLDVFVPRFPEVPIKFGIIGCANIARKNIRAMLLSRCCKCVAVASRSLSKCETWIKENVDSSSIGSIKPYGSYLDLLADEEIEVVYMPLPTTHHLEWVREAARAKKHIIIEKPVALNAQQLKEMIDIVNKENVILMDGVMFMHNRRLVNIMNLFKSHPLSLNGNIRRINSTFSFQGDADFQSQNIRVKKDGDPLGCLGDLGWYNIRFALCCFKFENPTAVKCNNINYNENGIPIECDAFVYWGSPETHDKVLSFHCSFCHMLRQDVEVVTDKHRRLLMNDFVIANEPSNKYTLEFCPGLRDLDTSAASETKEVTNFSTTPQEVKMFNNFSLLLCSMKNDVSDVNKSGFISHVNHQFGRIMFLSHLIIDKILESNQGGGILLYFTEEELKFQGK